LSIHFEIWINIFVIVLDWIENEKKNGLSNSLHLTNIS
jgi:hypothetical protein